MSCSEILSALGHLSWTQTPGLNVSGVKVEGGDQPGRDLIAAILHTVLESNEGCGQRTDGQVSCSEILSALGHLSWTQTPGLNVSGMKVEGGDQPGRDLIAAILQGAQQAGDGEHRPEPSSELLSYLGRIISSQMRNGEGIQQSENYISETRTDSLPEGDIKQALLLFLRGLLTTPSNAVNGIKEMDSSEDRGDSDQQPDEQASLDGVTPELLSQLALLWGGSSIPAHTEWGKDAAQSEHTYPENTVIKESKDGELGPSDPLSAESNTRTFSEQLCEDAIDLVAEEEVFQSAADAGSPQQIPEQQVLTIPTAVGLPLLNKRAETEGTSEGAGKAVDPIPERPIEPEHWWDTKTIGRDQATSRRTTIGGGDGGTTRYETYGGIYGDVIDGMEQISSDGSSNYITAGQNSSAKPDGPSSDVSEQARILYSRFETSGEASRETTIASSVEQAAIQKPADGADKVVDKIEYLYAKTAPDVVKLEPSSKAGSFFEREGGSQQLGQGMVDQGAPSKTPVDNNSEITSFGDIVAERIARTVENVAKTSRSDLTLRLKIDGGESVLLELKERAGTITIGIQCQDKALARALENQKETMFRNLETKNLNATISITTIGDDEQDGQRHWQRERREQQRNGWNGREMNSSSYFETLV